MNGEIGLTKRPREGVKWIKRAAELADQVDPPQPQSLHELAMLNEKGIDNIIFVVRALFFLNALQWLISMRRIWNTLLSCMRERRNWDTRRVRINWENVMSTERWVVRKTRLSRFTITVCRSLCTLAQRLTNCNVDIAAQQDHREACFALTAWYLVGSPGVLPQSDTEAYLWAKKAAGMGLAKAEYAFGYFTEVRRCLFPRVSSG